MLPQIKLNILLCRYNFFILPASIGSNKNMEKLNFHIFALKSKASRTIFGLDGKPNLAIEATIQEKTIEITLKHQAACTVTFMNEKVSHKTLKVTNENGHSKVLISASNKEKLIFTKE